ncbi:hypothetical protein J6590_059888 [Homalodisca vitripennis]|nr:hypothetical protein J6590_059888 [Homalodisca vitripennis]
MGTTTLSARFLSRKVYRGQPFLSRCLFAEGLELLLLEISKGKIRRKLFQLWCIQINSVSPTHKIHRQPNLTSFNGEAGMYCHTTSLA